MTGLKMIVAAMLAMLAFSLPGFGSPPKDAKSDENPLAKWVYPKSKHSANGVSTFSQGTTSETSSFGQYSTTDSFHQVVRFYVEKSGFEPPNWSILGREFPGDELNLPAFWQQGGGGGRRLTILHHIRPDSASFTLLISDVRAGESLNVVVNRSMNDDRVFIDLIRHSIGATSPPAQ